MLNNFYFKDDKPITISFGDKAFKEGCVDYLSKQYNYSLKELMKDTGLTDKDLNDLYEKDMSNDTFIDLLMDELQFRKSNYFNIILSGGRNL